MASAAKGGTAAGTAPTSSRTAARIDAILDATMELLREVGYDRLTIDAVVVRAAASKTTIYRRWPDKRALVCAALLARSTGHPDLPADARTLRADLLALLGLMAQLATTEDATAFASLLAASRTDPVIAEALQVAALQRRRADCRDIVQRAIGRGELHDSGLAVVLFDLAIGQIIVRFLLGDGTFTETEQAEFVDAVLIPVLTTPATQTRTREDNHHGHS
ncbi:MAG: TetR/AcrR family transcriptional regulator [Pseudonocardiaceae bacterium]